MSELLKKRGHPTAVRTIAHCHPHAENSPVALDHPGYLVPCTYRAALIQIGCGERRTRFVARPLDHVWVKLRHQVFRIFDLTNAAIKLGAFRDGQFLMCDVALDLRRGLELDVHSPYAAADATTYFNGLRRHQADDRSFLGDDDLLAMNIAANVAVNLELVLRDDGDVIAENSEISADD